MKAYLFVLGTATAALASSTIASEPNTALIVFGNDTVFAEVADSPDERSEGLMNRSEVPDGTGMLFVFEFESNRSFWMKDTYIALDIAFLDVDFRILNIHQMEPESEQLYDSAGPAMFALEVRQGWFAEHKIKVGDRGEVTFDPPGGKDILGARAGHLLTLDGSGERLQ